jgi:RND family efflux transporter MFP subunit
MSAIEFLVEWAVRSAVLILAGALILWALRVKAASIRLAAWTAMLAGSLAIPALIVTLPKMSVAVVRVAAPVVVDEGGPAPPIPVEEHPVSKRFDWARALLIVYALVAGGLLVRLGTGLLMSLRLRRASRATGQVTEGIEIRESDSLGSPVTFGIVWPVILLPIDWRQWDGEKLEAVLTHERSHIKRCDPAVQLLSALHRAMLWFSPLSWFLHQRLVRVAEEASDDAAVESTGDRAMYAKVLLEFMQRGVRSANWLGVPMARYGRPDERIHRILDGKTLSRRLTRWSVGAILGLGLPLAYLVAAVGPTAVQGSPKTSTGPVTPVNDAVAASLEPGQGYLIGLGTVTPYTVTIKSRVDGQLMSVSFKEGDLVQAGQILATIDSRPYQLQLTQAEGQLAREQARLGDFKDIYRPVPKPQEESMVSEIEGSIKAARAKLDEAKLQLGYTQIASPITGVAGLRLVDPGNIVHAADSTGIVIINQLRPIAVLFSIAEDRLPRVLANMREGASLATEAWSRDLKVKYATGRLTAVDNQIDTATGTVKLKAVFDNKDVALFPNQFVNVRLQLSTK